jgi:hypothetical protein
MEAPEVGMPSYPPPVNTIAVYGWRVRLLTFKITLLAF